MVSEFLTDVFLEEEGEIVRKKGFVGGGKGKGEKATGVEREVGRVWLGRRLFFYGTFFV